MEGVVDHTHKDAWRAATAQAQKQLGARLNKVGGDSLRSTQAKDCCGAEPVSRLVRAGIELHFLPD
jgi:hypothetical protein